MAKDTVTLSIEEYNRLRDFEREIKSGKVFTLESGFYSSSSRFYTESEIVKNIIGEGNDLRRRIDDLLIQRVKVKKMSIWEFLKWRKS